MAGEQRLAEVFVEVADSLIDDFDIIEFLQALSARCVELLGVSAAGILLVDELGELQVVAASDEHTRLLSLFALQYEQGPSVECFSTGSIRTNIDLNDPSATRGWPLLAARARETGYAFSHALPLRLRDRVVGALNLFDTATRELSPQEADIGQALADVATIAILQQRTLEQRAVEKSQLQAALTNRILVEQVKGVLAERWQSSVDEAFSMFRAYARAHHLRLSDFARQIIDGEFDTDLIVREIRG